MTNLLLCHLYRTRRHGPRTETWGTPEATETSSDEALSRTTLCVQSWRRKLFIQWLTSPVIPYQRSYWIRRMWLTLSKALAKSNMQISVWRPDCMLFAMSFTKSISGVSQEQRAWKPCWSEYKILCILAWFIMLLQTTCSISLETTHVKLIGL